KYAGYFHDGTLTGLIQEGNRVDFTLVSAEIDKRDRDASVPHDFRLKGMLSLEGVRNIQVNRKPYSEPMKMKSESADIYNLEISEHRLEIELTWEIYLPYFKEVSWQTITMDYDRLTWKEREQV